MSVFDPIKNVVGGITGFAGDMYEAAVQKLQDRVAEVYAAAPVMREVGYRLVTVDVEMSLSPRIILHMVREFVAHEEQFQAAFANHRDSKTIWSVLKGLQQANALAPRLAPANRPLTGLELEVGLPPILRLKYGEPRSEQTIV